MKERELRKLALKGECLELATYSKLFTTRQIVAQHKFNLHILKNDEDDYVRLEVAKQGAYLEELENDKCWFVRVHARMELKKLDKNYKMIWN